MLRTHSVKQRAGSERGEDQRHSGSSLSLLSPLSLPEGPQWRVKYTTLLPRTPLMSGHQQGHSQHKALFRTVTAATPEVNLWSLLHPHTISTASSQSSRTQCPFIMALFPFIRPGIQYTFYAHFHDRSKYCQQRQEGAGSEGEC